MKLQKGRFPEASPENKTHKQTKVTYRKIKLGLASDVPSTALRAADFRSSAHHVLGTEIQPVRPNTGVL